MKQMTRCKYHQQDIVSFCLNGNYGFMKLDVFSLCVLIVLPNIKHIISKHPLKCASLKYNNPSRQHKYNCLRCSFLLLNLNPPSMRLDLINYKQKAKLLAKVQEQFNQMASSYIESIQISISGIRDKLQSTIMQIQNSSIGLSSGTKTIQTLVEFWINKRSLNQKVRNIQKDMYVGIGMSGAQSLNTTIMKNIQLETERGISSTKQLFKDVPTAISQRNNYHTYTQTYSHNTNNSPITNHSHYQHEPQIEDQIQKQRVYSRISILQEQNKRILMELGQKRSSY